MLAPPYDVVDAAMRERLYARDLRNIVRIDHGATYPDDVAGERDAYTRAAASLSSWLEVGVLVRDASPALYVCEHEFTHPDGVVRRRLGVLAVVAARPWESSDLRAHERTLTGPKEDRLALLRATRTQTSPVFALWTGAPAADALLRDAAAGHALLGGRIDGEWGSEKVLLWRLDDAERVAGVRDALRVATLYVADGHHRYETAFAYAAQRRRGQPDAPPDAPFERCLVYLAAADDPSITVLPTHRLVQPGPGIAFSLDDLWARLDDAWDAEPAADAPAAFAAARSLRETHHAFVAVAHDGVALLRRPRHRGASPRDALDAAVLETEVLAPAGLSGDAIAAGGLAYTRDLSALARAVHDGSAVLGFGVLPVTVAEVIAVADAGETMPQKSTYFYPKVPTGLALHQV